MTDDTPTAFPPLSKVLIGNELVETVDARILHRTLSVGRVFAAWIRERIDSYNFMENQDFVVFSETGKNQDGGRPSVEYAISIDMAKELAMVERTEKGRAVRRYFIECERRLKAELKPGQAVHAARDFSAAFKGFVDIGRLIGLQGNEVALAANRGTIKLTGFDVLGAMGTTHLLAERQEELLTATQIGQRLDGVSAQFVNKKLEALGFQETGSDGRGGKTWHPTEKGKPFGKWLDTSKKHQSGTSVMQWKWYETIIPELASAPIVSLVGDSAEATA